MSRRARVDLASTDASLLPEAAAARLLARASELEAAGERGFTVADLRAAAAEAGIPAHAFEAALAEQLRVQPGAGTGLAAAVDRRRLGRVWALGVAVAAALLLALGVRVMPSRSAATVEEAIVLRCLAPGEAAALVRPLLRDRVSTVEYNPRAPRVLTIRGTPGTIERAKALLAEHEGGESPACAPASVAPVATASP